MTTPMSASALGTLPYTDVYLDQLSSEDEDDDDIEENVNISLKPLMSPRKKKRRPKVGMRQPRKPTVWQVRQQKRCLKVFYVIMMLSVISLVTFVLFRITHDYEASVEEEKQYVTVYPNGTRVKVPQKKPEVHLSPCTSFEVEDVWTQNFPMYITESPFRLIDANKDGTLDVVMAFKTVLNGYFEDENLLCGIYYDGMKPCFGGTMCLDGKTGEELWTHRTNQEIFALNCNVDIDNDGVKDCLSAGRTGLFMLLSGASGEPIWTFADNDVLEGVSNLYTAQFIQDMDSDGVQDVLNIQGGDPFRKPGDPVKHTGKLVIFSGRDGHVINWVAVPDGVESYYSPQVYYKKSGVAMVIFGSGGETQAGSLWVMPLHDILIKTTRNAKSIYTSKVKGVMTAPSLIDLTGDGTLDIVMRMFDSDTVAFNGETYEQIWKSTVPGSESYSTPGVGYFNDDDVPDFMIHSNIGPGYPLYYNSEMTILDGRNGEELLKPVKMAGSVFASPLVIALEGHGHDTFVYFNLDCLGHEGESKEFDMLNEGGKSENSRIDYCQLRFGAETYTRLIALNSHMRMPGEILYNSLERKSLEYLHKVNSSLLAKAFLDDHPGVYSKMLDIAMDRAAKHGKDKEEHILPKITVDDLDLETLVPTIQATTEMPVYTKQIVPPHSTSHIETHSPPGHRGNAIKPSKSDDMEDEDEDNPYGALLDKLQNMLGLHDDDGDEDGDEDVAIEAIPGVDRFTTRYPLPRTQKRPGYSTSKSGWRYGPPSYKDDGPPSYKDDDGDSMTTSSTFAKLLEKYPWIVEELSDSNDRQTPGYQQHRLSQSSRYRPSKSHDSETSLPRRQWGKNGDFWNRKEREVTAQEESVKNHVHKRAARQRHNDQIKNTGKQFVKNSKHELPHRYQTLNTHSKSDKPLKAGAHSNHHQRMMQPDLNSKLAKHLAKHLNLKHQRANRNKRHAGPHDAGGTMRLLSTGALAPVPHGVDSTRSIDLVFATYWSYPTVTEVRLPEEKECLKKWTANETLRLMPGNSFYGLDHDAYEEAAEKHCIVNKGHKDYEIKMKLLKSKDPMDIYPFNIHNGEMTVYRLRLTCKCGLRGKGTATKRCARILPFKEQQWAGYMGTFANSVYKPRKSP